MTEDWLDRSAPVREGEGLPVEQLEAYLKENLPGLTGKLAVRQFPAGFSNLTYLLKIDGQEIVLRRPPFGARIKSAHDMGREYHILSHLVDVYEKVPRPLLYCQDESVLGAPFYIMTRMKGIILRSQMPEAMNPAPDLMSRISESFVDSLAELHSVDFQAAGLGDLGHPEGYVRRQVEGWALRYFNARTDDIPEMESATNWLDANTPEESGAALIHNDFKYDNFVLDPEDWGRIIGILDWEMATIGDPLMDLGSSLGYWVQADDPEEIQALQFSPTTLPGNLTRGEVAERYARLTGANLEDIVFYYVYGLYKLAVIVQQIYARYSRGYTQDPRFADLIDAVRGCGRQAVQAIRRQQIDGLVV